MDAFFSRDVGTFAPEARAFFQADELRASVPLGVVDALAAGRPYGTGEPELWTVEDAGAPRLFAVRTPPYPFLLALGSPVDAAFLGRARAEAVTEGRLAPLDGVTAPKALARAFAEAYAARSGAEARVKVRLRLYALERVTPPAALPPGRFRVARADEVDLAVGLQRAFVDEIAAAFAVDRDAVAREVEDGHVFFWERDGRVVSMAQFGAETATAARVRLVFTPREHRGQGYAGACVAALSQALLDRGKQYVCLNADLANATSNALYQRLGYAPVEDFDEWAFSD